MAEPNLTALSGQEARFLAGGEYPVPVSQDGGSITVEYKPFGVELNFIPTVVDGDIINLDLTAAVSSIDPSNGITFGSFTIDAFRRRETSTVVELRDGESFAIAGLLSDDFRDLNGQVPWLGDVPVLGALFRSADYQRQQTELVIIVTAHLVTPTRGEALGPAHRPGPPADRTRPVPVRPCRRIRGAHHGRRGRGCAAGLQRVLWLRDGMSGRAGTMKRFVTVAASMAALSACAPDPTHSSFFGEAGAAYNDGGFGNATMNNVLLQSGNSSYRVSLAHRFDSEVQSTINFEFNSYALDEAARAVLRQQADWIRQFPEVRFKVFGHTDLVGGTAFNRQLGLRRAEAVVLYLASLGIDRNRLEAVVSYGEEQPLIVTEGRERRNRRTVTEVSGFVENHPGVLNGRYAEVIFREYVAGAVAGPRIEAADAAGVGSEGGG